MKKSVSLLLAAVLVLGLMACGKNAQEDAGTAQAAQKALFQVGFGRTVITPESSVPLASYGNAAQRLSQGKYSELYMNVLAVTYDQDTLLMLTIDHSWFSTIIANPIKNQITNKFKIPATHILMQGTHTHQGPEVGETSIPAMGMENERTIKLSLEAVEMALNDRKPAQIYVGSVKTEKMNFVRRYFMDDGSLTGDNYAGTGTKRVAHETEADGEMQLMKFVREGGKDILIANFQAHPHLEARSLNLSYQNVGAFRTAVEKKLDIYSIYWQGAAGNLNSTGSLEGEKPYQTRDEYGEALANYAASVYDTMEKVESGPIKVIHQDFTCYVNHTEDHLVETAMEIQNYFQKTNNASAGMEMGKPYGIRSVYHASAIIKKSNMGTTNDIPVAAFSFGDVSGVVVPYEMFDTSGMQIKSQTPFKKTFIFGYAYPGSLSYMPDELAFDNGGYETNQCRYVRGTAEKLVANYLDMLSQLKQ